METSSELLSASLCEAVMVLSCDNTKIWLTKTPVSAPKGLKDWEKLRRLVAVTGSPSEYT
ncbi:hypothetical protein SDC9_142068 [bioreactor metagenome]|uniref:Uncharacterized protein n=1 Tax=bioreactor metagenome TaxID=1076179 RepID=A0A645E075_9ZZZZ